VLLNAELLLLLLSSIYNECEMGKRTAAKVFEETLKPATPCKQKCIGVEGEAATDDILQFLDGMNLDLKQDGVDVVGGGGNGGGAIISKAVDDVWEHLAGALDNWTQRIVDTESRQKKCTTFRQDIGCALHRMSGDGLLNQHDINELQYVADLWSKLLTATSCYAMGCCLAKRVVITLLLELYTLKQITTDLFVESCLQL